MHFDIVVVTDTNRGIGLQGTMPWRLARELAYFKAITTSSKMNHKNAVIMGRKTWESLPDSVRPLPGRLNVVLTQNVQYPLPENVVKSHTLNDALKYLEGVSDLDRVFVIGGGEVYRQAMSHPQLDRLYITSIDGDFQCDTFFPIYDDHFKLALASELMTENDLTYTHQVWQRTKQLLRNKKML